MQKLGLSVGKYHALKHKGGMYLLSVGARSATQGERSSVLGCGMQIMLRNPVTFLI